MVSKLIWGNNAGIPTAEPDEFELYAKLQSIRQPLIEAVSTFEKAQLSQLCAETQRT